MRLSHKLLTLCAAFAVASCASIQPRPPEVQLPPGRISLKGFSLVPLNEHGWLIGTRNPRLLSLGKLGKYPEENIVIRAIFIQLPAFHTDEDLVRLVQEAEAKNINPERLKVIRHEVVTYPKKGTNCAKSYAILQDHGAAKTVGKTGVMMQESLTLTCAHPKDKSAGINVGYSHRYYPAQRDPGFIERATSVLNSVEFADP